MSRYRFVTADQVDFISYIRALNAAYRNYYVWIEMTPNSMRALIERDSIDLSASAAILYDDRIIGMGLLGIRQTEGWIGGVGVLSEYRGQGVGRQIMEGLISQGQRRGLQAINLEVIVENTVAYRLYEHLNFKVRRQLHIMERDLQPTSRLNGYRVQAFEADAALDYYTVFHDIKPPWQRSLHALRHLAPNLDGRIIVHEQSPQIVLGYAVGWMNFEQIRLLDVGTYPTQNNRIEVTRALIASIHHELPYVQGSILNVAHDDPTYTALLELGYTTELSQYEMRLAF